MTWTDEIGPWDFTPSVVKNQYNEGNLISDSSDPIWNTAHTGVPITDTHDPCGYWPLGYSEPVVPDPPSSWTLWGAGQNSNRCLGILEDTFQPVLKEISFESIIDTGCQNNNGMFIANSDKAVYGIGKQINGTIPNGAAENTTYTTITLFHAGPWKALSTQSNHSLFIAEDGTLWSCGKNNYGQLGRGLYANNAIHPLGQIGSESNWTFCHAGYFTTYVINSDNEMWVCGFNGYGNLGLGNTTNYNTLQQVAGSWAFVTSPPNWYGQASAITTDGVLYGCGDNSYGGLGLGFTSFRPNVWTVATTDLRFSKSQLTSSSSQEAGHFLTTDGDLYVAGFDTASAGYLGIDGTTKNDLTLVPGGLTFVDIASHGAGGFALTDTGDIYITGGVQWGTKKIVWTLYDTGFDKIYSASNNMWAMKSV